MATTVSAMKARLGNTDYYILSMKAEELTKKVTIPKDMDGWDDMSIEERYQRDINYQRVKNQIAPYFANNDSRFCGAVIVAAMNFDKTISFEPLADVTTKGLPGLYKTVATNMGFLTFSGGEKLVPLDGQHRLKAIEFAISGRDEKGADISGIKPCTQLADEDITVILVPYEPKKARNLFTRVNRYAKATASGQNIITDDDDVLAVLTREVANKLIGGRLARYTGGTLGPKNVEFTTLATIYTCNKWIIKTAFPCGEKDLDPATLPSKEKVSSYKEKVEEVWGVLLGAIDVFADALNDCEESGDQKRQDIRKANLLGKPVAQECLVHAFMKLTDVPTKMTYEEACKQLNSLPWTINERNVNDVWQRVLWTGGVDGNIITAKKNRGLATEMIVYLADEKFDDESKKKLTEEYRKQFPEAERKTKSLPKRP